jgi:16S rRNA (guanine(966)-N(2))-methyltransferase RsmD
MRVISGKYKGVKLFSPKTGIRPTLDRVKEAVFDVLQFKTEGAAVLDLFAGSGSYGIEAVSRGCKSAVFNDISPQARKLIEKNCLKAGFKPEITGLDYKAALKKFYDGGVKFDIIFIDAPFDSGFGEDAANIILEKGLLSGGGVIVYERDSKSAPKFAGASVRTKKYGNTSVDFITPDNGDT